MWNHSIAAGFLQASFEECMIPPKISYDCTLTIFKVDKWIEQQTLGGLALKDLAMKRHGEMAPIGDSTELNAPPPPDPTRVSIFVNKSLVERLPWQRT